MPTRTAIPAAAGRPPDAPSRWGPRTAPALIALAALVCWHNSFSGAFVFDDVPTIRENLTIRHLWPLREVLSPPSVGSPVTGRPLVNLTLAFNYAVSGTQVWSYHVLNLVVHVLAGLTLFGLVRRTLRLRSGHLLIAVGRGRRTPPPDSDSAAFGDAAPQSNATLLALAIALLWTVHPLQTESVTYVVQRTESLMGLFFLLTLYCFARAVQTQPTSHNASSHREPGGAGRGDPAPTSGNPSGLLRRFAPRNDSLTGISALWFLASFLACLLGMATKEVMVAAPLIVFLYDRTFVAGSFREAFRRRRGYYASLAATWVLLIWLVAGAGSRGGTAGFALGVTPWGYALRQGETIVRYLGLSLWPHPLTIDYGADLAAPPAAIVACTLLIALLAAATGAALWRRPVAGFVGAWFFAILAPSSSVVPVATEIMAEHRMYLPLAAVITVGVAGLYRLAGRTGLAVLAALAVGWGWLTVQRNAVYRSDLALWTDAVVKRPANARAHCNLGGAWLQTGQPAAALAEERAALRLQPDLAAADFYAGKAALQLGRDADAARYFEATLRTAPDYAMAHVELGNLALRAGRFADACDHYEAVLRQLPQFAPVHYNLAMARLQMGRPDEAVAEFEATLRLQPTMAAASYNLGTVLLSLGRLPQAQAQFERTLQLDPDNSAAHNNLANILVRAGRWAEAVDHYRAALRSDPANVAAHCNLGTALWQLQRLPEARNQFEAALRLQPDCPPARAALDELNVHP